jgi:hypothetical protein
MKCDECQEDIVGTYFERDGKNVCEKDYEVRYIFFTQTLTDRNFYVVIKHDPC